MKINKKLNPICLTVKLAPGHKFGSKTTIETRKFYLPTKEKAENELAALVKIGVVLNHNILDISKKEKTTASKTATEVRKTLNEKYPDVKFTVHSDNFANGNAVNIGWIDGPTSNEVEIELGKFQSGYFDDMTDNYVHSNHNEKIPQVKYLTYNRKMSNELYDIIKNKLINEGSYGIERNTEDLLQLVYGEFQKTKHIVSKTKGIKNKTKKEILDFDEYFEKLSNKK